MGYHNLPSLPNLRGLLLHAFMEGGCEQQRQAECRGLWGKPPAPKVLSSILSLPWSGTTLRQQTPEPPDDAPKQNQPSGAPLWRARSHQSKRPAWELNPHWNKGLVHSQLWTVLSPSPANPRASGVFSGFKWRTWWQLLFCSWLNVWAPFSPRISELGSWN